MTELFFPVVPVGQPRVVDAAAADRAIERIAAGAVELEDTATADWFRGVAGHPSAGAVLRGIFSNSPFLTGCAAADPAFLKQLLLRGPDAALAQLANQLKDRTSRGAIDRDGIVRAVRIARRRVALLTAVADLAGYWPMERVTHALSDFADVAMSAVIAHLFAAAAEAGDLVLRDEYFPERDCGYFLLAMGKHGARELNYSSDLDLIAVYDPDKVDYRGKRTPQQLFIRMTQSLVAILQELTVDGYAFRVDLRLRPDPGSTPVAISRAAALNYYATRGANWERAAMIKARPAAGDIALGRQFLGELQPFVWREHLDFATVGEISALKRQINAQRGGGTVGFLGHNIKLGRGGIREIEFFAQTQQLVHGGRDPYLRCQRTVDALTTLSEAGCIDEAVTDELTEAYDFLRNLEHRLQMVDDRQTQTLPGDEAGMRHIAAFMGFEDLEAFRETVLFHLRRVEGRYAQLFEDPGHAPDLIKRLAGADGEGTASALAAFGLRDPLTAGECLRRVQRRCVAADKDGKGNLAAALVARIAESSARSADPDAALAAAEGFLARLRRPRRTLSLLAANAPLTDLVVDIALSAPALADSLIERPERLETAASAGFFGPAPQAALLRADCAQRLAGATGDEDRIERAATWAGDQRFWVGANIVRQTLDPFAAGRVLCEAAAAVTGALARQFARENDAASDIAVVALGRFGQGDPTVASPLELMFLHAGSPAPGSSHLRHARRLINALTARTNAGRTWVPELSSALWGGPGPLVSSIEGFTSHMTSAAGGAQLLALTQARVLCGPQALVCQVDGALSAILGRPEARAAIAAQVTGDAGFRAATTSQPTRGLCDFALLLAVLRLHHAGDERLGAATSIPTVFAVLREIGALDEAEADELRQSYRLLRRTEDLLAVAMPGPPALDAAPKAAWGVLRRATGAADLEQLGSMLAAASAGIGSTLDRVLGVSRV